MHCCCVYCSIKRTTAEQVHMMAAATVCVVSTSPFAGQKPGTSGLRKKVTEFLDTPKYAENFVQATLSAMGDRLHGSTLVVGGDGRYGTVETVVKIIKMAAANKVGIILILSM